MSPTCSYLVCAIPRSGSTLLCEALTKTGLAGRPREYFEALKATGQPRKPQEYFTDLKHPELERILDDVFQLARLPDPITADYLTYLAHVLQEGTTPNGVFGAKMMWGYFGDFLARLYDIPTSRGLSVPELLATIFPNLHYILVTRKDKVRQAVSLWKAIQTWTWREDEDANAVNLSGHPIGQPRFHFDAIDHLHRQIVAHEQAWQEFFSSNGIHPYRVDYEELAAYVEETILSILHFLGIPLSEHRGSLIPGMKRQSDGVSEEWVARYQAMKVEQMGTNW